MKSINDMYKDISPELNMSWNRDVASAVGARAVKNALIGIVTTKKGDRPFDPDFGSDVENQLFENMTPLTANTIQKSITSAIRKYEPRVIRLNVTVVPQYDSNSIVITITFSILDNPDTLEQLKLQLSSSR